MKRAASDLGEDAVRRIAKLWQVDDDRVVWTDKGFDWWPGSFRVSVRAEKGEMEDHGDARRIVVRTAVLKDVPIRNVRTRLAIGKIPPTLSPTFAWVYMPVGLKHDTLTDRPVWFQSAVYAREDTQEWLPEFFGRMALLQPIWAERYAASTGREVGAQADVSPLYQVSETHPADDMLGVADAIYIPAGREPNRWIGTGEFEAISERFGMQDACFGFGGETGLTLETPIGSSSAHIRLLTDAPHPTLGSGLLAIVQLPDWRDEAAIVEQCAWLNFYEAMTWTEFPQLGSWRAKEVGDGVFAASHVMFIPNAFYKRGLATNAALWQVGRAKWVKKMLWPKLED